MFIRIWWGAGIFCTHPNEMSARKFLGNKFFTLRVVGSAIIVLWVVPGKLHTADAHIIKLFATLF